MTLCLGEKMVRYFLYCQEEDLQHLCEWEGSSQQVEFVLESHEMDLVVVSMDKSENVQLSEDLGPCHSDKRDCHGHWSVVERPPRVSRLLSQ